MASRKRLALIDGHALAFRAFHALKEAGLRSSRGEPTYAVFGFAQILLSMIQEQRPEYVAVSFDVGRTFRDDMYDAYKAGRAETPEEFEPQLERIKQLVDALNMPVYTADGYEADDVIGTLARQATAQDVETLILTGDTDSLQLVDEHVKVLLANPYGQRTTTTVYDEAKVLERYEGLRPNQLADLRGLKGDTSDNIPGVKGIGEKGAINLLNQFGSIEQIYDQFAKVPKRYQKPLDGQRETALFSKKLATIVCDVPVRLDLAAAAVHDYDRAAVIRLFQELEIGASSGLLKKLPPSSNGPAEVDDPAPPLPPAATGQLDMFATATLPATLPPAPATGGPAQLSMFGDADAPVAAPIVSHGDYRAVTTPEQLAELVNALSAAPAFAFDTEASGLRPFAADLVGISIAVTPGAAWYVPLGHTTGEQLPREQALAALRPFFTAAQQPKYAHNAKFDIEILLSAGVPVAGLAFDTMIAAGLLGKRTALKDLAFYELKLEDGMMPIEELIGRGAKQISFGEVPIAQATPYAAADADMTLRLVPILEAELRANPALYDLYQRVELPLVSVLVAMEQAGITLDTNYINALGKRLEARIDELVTAIHAAAGRSFNINSGQQLNDVLFNSGKFGLDPKELGLSKLKTGGYSITAEVLEQIAPIAPIAAQILQYRQLSKLKSTYVDTLPTLVDPHSGRVHTSYSQLGAATGRLSSDSPNLQNIPVRTQEGREIRRGFVAQPGHRFIAADYSQIELRVLAYYLLRYHNDASLARVFQEGQDIHAATASRLFGVTQHQVDKNQRRIAKCVAAGTLVFSEHGVTPIEHIGSAPEEEVTAIDLTVAQEGRQRRQATGFYNGGLRPTIKITTQRGYRLEATSNHQVRCLDNEGNYIWQRIGDLRVGDHVALSRGAMLFGHDELLNVSYQRRHDRKLQLPERLSPDLARFLGYFVAEGHVSHGRTSSTLVIANKDPEVIADLCNLSRRLFNYLPSRIVDRNGVCSMRWNCSRLVEIVEQLGIGNGAMNTCIPDLVMRGSYASVTEFLRGLFEGGGSISASFISVASKSEVLIHQIQTLLLVFGIVSQIERRDVPNHGRRFKLRLIGRESRALFAKHIGFISTRKQERLATLLMRRVTNEPVALPGQKARLERMYQKTKCELKELIHTCIRTKSPSVELTYRRLGTILEHFPDHTDPDAQILQDHFDRNLFYDRIVNIEYSESHVYDLVVPDTNTYIANGFVSHNTVVFGIIYGISAFGLSQRLGLERSEAQALINGVFSSFPGIQRYIDSTLATGREHGYVQTLFGRRRMMPDLKVRGPRSQAAAREAINAPIQGTAADIMKIAMINVHKALGERGMATRMLLQVHDELILEAPEAEVAAAARLVHDVMASAYDLTVSPEESGQPEPITVPLGVEVESGPNWDELTPVAW
jgi:DNA polymerase-1